MTINTQQTFERQKLLSEIRKVRSKMIKSFGEGVYTNFLNKIRMSNKLTFFIETIKSLNQDFPIPVSFINSIHAMENSPFNGIVLPNKAPDLLVMVEEELEIVSTNIRNYLDVNPKFADLYNEMVAAYATHKPKLP